MIRRRWTREFLDTVGGVSLNFELFNCISLDTVSGVSLKIELFQMTGSGVLDKNRLWGLCFLFFSCLILARSHLLGKVQDRNLKQLMGEYDEISSPSSQPDKGKFPFTSLWISA